jgi:hypothetical protein
VTSTSDTGKRKSEEIRDGGLLRGVVEADYTHLTPKKLRKGKPYVKKENSDVVMGTDLRISTKRE